jgi:hypothetical protein
MRTRLNILVLSTTAFAVFYVVGYFLVVQKQLQNAFISWPILKPLPMKAYYRISCLRVIYEPIVRLDQMFFPLRWQCPPTPAEHYVIFPEGFDLRRTHYPVQPNKLDAPNPAIAPQVQFQSHERGIGDP